MKNNCIFLAFLLAINCRACYNTYQNQGGKANALPPQPKPMKGKSMKTTIHRTNVVNPSHCTTCKNFYNARHSNGYALPIHLRYTTEEERYHLIVNNRITESELTKQIEVGNEIFAR